MPILLGHPEAQDLKESCPEYYYDGCDRQGWQISGNSSCAGLQRCVYRLALTVFDGLQSLKAAFNLTLFNQQPYIYSPLDPASDNKSAGVTINVGASRYLRQFSEIFRDLDKSDRVKVSVFVISGNRLTPVLPDWI